MAGEVLPDDGKIGPDDLLYRRIGPDKIVPSRDGQGIRLSSAALKSSGGALSVYVASLVTIEKLWEQIGPFHIAEVSAKVVRSQNCRLQQESDDANNPAHAHIYGDGPDGSLSGGQASRIAATARIILNPKLPQPVVGGSKST
jgi:hypothetical protein